MRRVIVLVEGQTEETFINELLTHHLALHGVYATTRLMGNARNKSRRGGIRGWSEAKRDIVNHLNQDGEVIVTQMVDYYGLPSTAPDGWPGRADAALTLFQDKALTVQNALKQDIALAMGPNFDLRRFIPYVVMHEFEGLLFSNCAAFADSIRQSALAPKLAAIRNQFGTPEEINDSPITAPSKRIANLVPGYRKPLFGAIAAIGVGLQDMRSECPQFAAWLSSLESLGD